MASNPTRLYISSKLKKVLEEAGSYDPFFKDLANKEQFFLALSLGFLKRHKVELGKKEEFVRKEYLLEDDDSFLKAVAVADTKDPKVIIDLGKVYEIAEQYASGGADFLRELVCDDPGSFAKKLAALLRETGETVQSTK